MSKQLVELKARFKAAATVIWGETTEADLCLRYSSVYDTDRVTKTLKEWVEKLERWVAERTEQEEGLANGTLVKRTAIVWNRGFDGDSNNYERAFVVKANDDTAPIAKSNTGLQFVEWVN